MHISAFLAYYQGSNKFSGEDVERIGYAYRSIRSDFIKIGLLYAVAVPFGQGIYLTSVLVPMFALRMLAGGLHRPSFWQCFFMSAGWIFGGMLAGSFIINHSMPLAGVIMGGSALVFLVAGIVPSPRHRKLSEQSKRKRKCAALILEALFLVIVLCSNKSIIGKGAFTSTVITNVQVIFWRLKNEYNKRYARGTVDSLFIIHL